MPRAAIAPRLEQRSAYKKAEKEAHNTYVSVLVETGLVGFMLFAHHHQPDWPGSSAYWLGPWYWSVQWPFLSSER